MKKNDDFPDEYDQMDTNVGTMYKKRNIRNKHFYFFDDEINVWF
jgi:hypothetical protein